MIQQAMLYGGMDLEHKRLKVLTANLGCAVPLWSTGCSLVLPLKQPCSLSRPVTATSDYKFGVYIIYISYFNRRETSGYSISRIFKVIVIE